MKLLLDTCTFLWLAADAPELSPSACDRFADPASEVFLSTVSAWEIATKHNLGKLRLPEPPHQYVPSRRLQMGIEELPLAEEAALHVARLPRLHADPFDRLLICQSIVHGLAILTPTLSSLSTPHASSGNRGLDCRAAPRCPEFQPESQIC